MTNQAPAVINARRILTDISAADLENARWKTATPIAITRTWAGEAAPPERHAEVRILWSDEALNVRFVCKQHEPLIVNANPQVLKKTIGLWDRDVCEIFIAPDPTQIKRYFEFEAAPTGEWIDLAIHITDTGRETDWDFNSEMSAAGRVKKNEVVIGMRIPWDDWIHKPQRGEKWRVNLFRCVGTGNSRYLAWQPTYAPEPNFHVPEVFGWLNFI
jgi:hypothetical protein